MLFGAETPTPHWNFDFVDGFVGLVGYHPDAVVRRPLVSKKRLRELAIALVPEPIRRTVRLPPWFEPLAL